jgi:hypothetical protein
MLEPAELSNTGVPNTDKIAAAKILRIHPLPRG